jgi:hypothetical protein
METQKNKKPTYCKDVVFENDTFILKKICFWPYSSIWRDAETGLLKVLLSGSAFNVGGISTIAFEDGKRAIENDFWYLGNFKEGLIKVGVKENGYGFLNKNMQLIVPPKYNWASNFQNSFSVVAFFDKVAQKETYHFVDTLGNEFNFEKEYNTICDNCEGLFRVSNLKAAGIKENYVSLAYFSDYDEYAGYWGYTDTNGKEIIKPQYIYALDFENGLALVCKGKWIKDKKWNNKYNKDRYWTEEELWGMIDKTGKEVVPCKFDEIKYFFTLNGEKDNRCLQAHYGGWNEGKWGIINYSGEWIIEPIFGDLYYDITDDGCFEFSNDDKWDDPDNVPIGIYNINEKRILFEPQFTNIDFLSDGTFKVEIYSEELGRTIEQIIDQNGNPLFNSSYTYLFAYGNCFETMIRDDNGHQIYGLIDKNGNEILPCKYEISYNGIWNDKKEIVFQKDGKYGLMTYDGAILIDPEYSVIRNHQNKLFIEAKKGGKEFTIDDGKYGLLTYAGQTIIPFDYSSISIEDNTIIARCEEGTTIYKLEMIL